MKTETFNKTISKQMQDIAIIYKPFQRSWVALKNWARSLRSVAQVTQVTPANCPRNSLKLRYQLFFPEKSRPTHYLESQNQAKNFPWFSRVSQSKFEAKRSRGSLVMNWHKNKQTNRDYYFLYMIFYSRRKPPKIHWNNV